MSAYEAKASKNDKADAKPDYSMLPKIFMDQVAYVMMAGASKYGRFNYTKGHEITRLTSAATRHLKLIESGEDVDADTSERLGVEIHHWACVAANALMALHQLELGTAVDDRFNPGADLSGLVEVLESKKGQGTVAGLMEKWEQEDSE